jgi:hypothetical protein
MAPENTYSRTLAPTYKVGRGATHPKGGFHPEGKAKPSRYEIAAVP